MPTLIFLPAQQDLRAARAPAHRKLFLGKRNQHLPNVAKIRGKTFLLSQPYSPGCYPAYGRLHKVIMFPSNASCIPSCCQEEILFSQRSSESSSSWNCFQSWVFQSCGESYVQGLNWKEAPGCLWEGGRRQSSDNVLPEQQTSSASHSPRLGKAVGLGFFFTCTILTPCLPQLFH